MSRFKPYWKGSEYNFPSDWLDISNPEPGNINLLLSDVGKGAYAWLCNTTAGQYQIDWGDGSITLHDSGAIAEHVYTKGAGLPCKRGYTTFKAVISPMAGGLTKFKAALHSTNTINQSLGTLGCVINSATILDISNAFFENLQLTMKNQILEFCDITAPNLTNISDAFSYTALKTFNGSLPMASNVRSAFSDCISLHHINLTLPAAININYIFSGCISLLTCDLTAPNATTLKAVFNGCYLLEEVNLTAPKANIVDSMFSGNSALKNVEFIDLGINTISTNLSYAFDEMGNLVNINLPNTKISQIGASLMPWEMGSLQTLVFHPDSPFNGTKVHMFKGIVIAIDISSNSINAEQLNAIFTSLPVLDGKIIDIAGCLGAETCDKTIATNKGWIVNTDFL